MVSKEDITKRPQGKIRGGGKVRVLSGQKKDRERQKRMVSPPPPPILAFVRRFAAKRAYASVGYDECEKRLKKPFRAVLWNRVKKSLSCRGAEPIQIRAPSPF